MVICIIRPRRSKPRSIRVCDDGRRPRRSRFIINRLCAPVAQRLEQQTHNLLVRGSNPCGGTNKLTFRLLRLDPASLLGFHRVFFEDFGDTFVDWLGDGLGVRLQVSAGGSLQYLGYRSAEDNPVTDAI